MSAVGSEFAFVVVEAPDKSLDGEVRVIDGLSGWRSVTDVKHLIGAGRTGRPPGDSVTRELAGGSVASRA